LPQGLRVGYLLVNLSSEVSNGGFYQWFTNSSGQAADLTLEELRAIGDVKTAAVVEQAIALNHQLEERYPAYQRRWDQNASPPSEGYWEDVDANFLPELDRLSSLLYDIEDGVDSMWNSLYRFLRQHPDRCLHRPQQG